MAKGTHITATEFDKRVADLDFIPICDEEIGGGMHQYFYLSRYGIAVKVVTNNGNVEEVETVESCKCSKLE
jgi:hypothetical protein